MRSIISALLKETKETIVQLERELEECSTDDLLNTTALWLYEDAHINGQLMAFRYVNEKLELALHATLPADLLIPADSVSVGSTV